MATTGRRSFAEPDERVEMAGGRVVVESVTLGDVVARRVTHAPGWRWTEHSGPEVGAPRCPRTHVGLVASGRVWVEPEEGDGFEAGVGDFVVVAPGHDAWTLGDEPFVLVEFQR